MAVFRAGIFYSPPQPTQREREAPKLKTVVYGNDPPIVNGQNCLRLLPALIIPYCYPSHVPQQYGLNWMNPHLYGLQAPPPIDPDDGYGILETTAPTSTIEAGCGAGLEVNGPSPTIVAATLPIIELQVNAPSATIAATATLGSNGAGLAPTSSAVGYIGAVASIIAPVYTITAEVLRYNTGNASMRAPSAYVTGEGTVGIVANLIKNSPFPKVTAVGYIVSRGVLTTTSPFPFMDAYGHVPSDFSAHVLHNMEYGHIGKLEKYINSPGQTGTGSVT